MEGAEVTTLAKNYMQNASEHATIYPANLERITSQWLKTTEKTMKIGSDQGILTRYLKAVQESQAVTGVTATIDTNAKIL